VGAVGLLATIDIAAPALVVLVVQGAATAVFEVLALTTMQRLSPPSSIGRVLGLYSTASGGTKLAGSLVAPAAIATVGVRGGLIAVSVAALAGVAVLAGSVLGLGRRLRRRRAELAPVTERLAGVGIFAAASQASVERLAMQLAVVPVDAGDVVIREGESADDFYVIDAGRFVVDAGGHEINRLGSGDWCGELGLLRRSPRTATVVAETDGVLWRIPGDEIVTALTAGTRLPGSIVDDMKIRIARSDAVTR